MAHILVIDDDPAVRETVGRTLEGRGHHVRAVADGAAGMDALALNGADLVITDIFMPGQDGIVTLLAIRKAFPDVPIIVMSGGDSTGRISLLRDAELFGAARMLSKPFRPQELLSAVDHALGAGA